MYTILYAEYSPQKKKTMSLEELKYENWFYIIHIVSVTKSTINFTFTTQTPSPFYNLVIN